MGYRCENHVILGVTGSIAAYKSAEIVRNLRKRGFDVKVVMTSAATRFITPLTLETLSSNPVTTELFPESGEWDIQHISLAQWGDLLLIAPASANIIGKMASGIADDSLSTLAMTFHSPVIIAPAMNTRLFTHPVVHRNLNRLSALGYEIVEPETGDLACGESGKGRLADISRIIAQVENSLSITREFQDTRFLITAGATEEPLDPVRILTNRSSGKMGIALARAAHRRGGKVFLVYGRVSVAVPGGISAVQVHTAEEMREEVLKKAPETDIIMKAAAVADYRAMNPDISKIKKSGDTLSLRLVPTPDILEELGRKKTQRQILVGFALETDDLVVNAKKKLHRKHLDMIVANNPLEKGAGFECDTNRVCIIDRLGNQNELPLMSKERVSDRILDHLRDNFITVHAASKKKDA
jgi:phosphopantothenoylcysteine decarboxylase/phosphopantothenate--cysteine ligase